MKTLPFSSSLRFLTTAAALLASVSLSHASLIYETSFIGSAGPFETATGYEEWHVHRSATAITTNITLDGDGKLLINNPTNATASSQFGGAIYTGNTAIADGQVSGVFQYVANVNQSSGLLARIQNPTGDGSRPEGYFAGILRHNPGTGNQTYLVIAKDIEFNDVYSNLLISTPISVTSMNYYRLDFSFEGSTLTATLYNEAGDIEIKSITATDTAYLSGAVGLRANLAARDRTIGFDSFQVTAIPEPSTALLLLPVGLIALPFLRKKQTR